MSYIDYDPDCDCMSCRSKKEKEMQNKLMTRKEAEAKLFSAKIPTDMTGHYIIMDVLEALGLIEFKGESVKIINVTDGDRVEIQRYGVVVHRDSDGKQKPDEPDLPRTPESVLQKSIERQSLINPIDRINPKILIGALRAKGYEIVKSNGEG